MSLNWSSGSHNEIKAEPFAYTLTIPLAYMQVSQAPCRTTRDSTAEGRSPPGRHLSNEELSIGKLDPEIHCRITDIWSQCGLNRLMQELAVRGNDMLFPLSHSTRQG